MKASGCGRPATSRCLGNAAALAASGGGRQPAGRDLLIAFSGGRRSVIGSFTLPTAAEHVTPTRAGLAVAAAVGAAPPRRRGAEGGRGRGAEGGRGQSAVHATANAGQGQGCPHARHGLPVLCFFG